jgi:predicted nuclease of predicted toxin-antitoxin system
MKFLVDQNQSPLLAEYLRDAGHDAVHTSELGLSRAEDPDLILLARSEGRIVISGDTDFGALLALANETTPSVILFRQRRGRSASARSALLLDHLGDVTTDLEAGSVIIFEDARIRIRKLPLLG